MINMKYIYAKFSSFIEIIEKNRKKLVIVSNIVVVLSLITIYFSFSNEISFQITLFFNNQFLYVILFGIISYSFLFLSWNIYSKNENIDSSIYNNFVTFSYSNMAKYIPGSLGLFFYRTLLYKVTKDSLKKILKGVLCEQFIPIIIFTLLFGTFWSGFLLEDNIYLVFIFFILFLLLTLKFLNLIQYFYYILSFLLHVFFQLIMLYLFFDMFCENNAFENSFKYLLSNYLGSFLIGAPAGIGIREGISLLLLDNQSCLIINALIYLRVIYLMLDFLFFFIGLIIKKFKVDQKN
jgi:hypothetical protein